MGGQHFSSEQGGNDDSSSSACRTLRQAMSTRASVVQFVKLALSGVELPLSFFLLAMPLVLGGL